MVRRLTVFERLSRADVDFIRHIVHQEFEACREKKAEARYPTIANLHQKIQLWEDLPSAPWSISTTRTVLISMGFR